MARHITCDICGREIRTEDIRHIGITRTDPHSDSEKPTMVEQETCVHCAEDVRKYILLLSTEGGVRESK